MNKDRIQIDGVWYVREQQAPKKIDVTKFKGIVTESDKYCFEATLIEREDGTYFNDFDVKFTDKRKERTKDGNWKTDDWDNMTFFRGCLKRNPESLGMLKMDVCEQGVEEFIALLNILDEEGWFQSIN